MTDPVFYILAVVKNDAELHWHRFRDYADGRTNVRCAWPIEPGKNRILGGDPIPQELMIKLTGQPPILCPRCF